MYLEHFHISHHPFSDSAEVEFFFPENRREGVCQSLILDFLAGKPLLKLVGREGVGKTLFCNVIVERLPGEYRIAMVTNPTGSLETLLSQVGKELGLAVAEASEQMHLSDYWRQMLAEQQDRGVRFLLIIDEAEKMFAATLERLLHLVTEESADAALTLLLVGRPELDEQLAHMATLGTAVEFSATYHLAPLSESATRQYLRHRCTAAGMSRGQFAEVFTEPVITKIIASGQGNPRLINTLAEEALQNFCAEKSFMVLLDHVEPEAVEEPVPTSRIVELYELLLEHKLFTGAVAAVMVSILALGIMLYGAGNRQPSPPVPLAAEAPAVASPGSSNTNPPLPPRDQRDGEALFRERLGASAGWLAGMYKGGYTIQLMMLSSTSAEYSLTDTLVQDDYYPLRDQFYILRKLSKPPTLLVFYGVYDSLDAAREARNSMPVFLRRHHPYPLAISEAMRKIEQ